MLEGTCSTCYAIYNTKCQAPMRCIYAQDVSRKYAYVKLDMRQDSHKQNYEWIKRYLRITLIKNMIRERRLVW